MKIWIQLPPDRRKPGRLTLKDETGKTLLVCPALGKTADSIAVARRNPRRDPERRGGDTPAGSYAPARIIAYAKARRGIGRIALPLDPTSGQAAKAERNGRDGLLIHGGRGNARLQATAGCIRLLDIDMARLASALGGRRAKIEISESQEATRPVNVESVAQMFVSQYRSLSATDRAAIRGAIC